MAYQHWRSCWVNCSSQERTETPYGSSRGVLGLLALSLPGVWAACKVCKTFKPTNSGVEDIHASERNARLSSVGTLASALRARFQTLLREVPLPREERSGMHLIETVVLLRSSDRLIAEPETLFGCQM